MSSTITTPTTFTFHLNSPSPLKPRTNFTSPPTPCQRIITSTPSGSRPCTSPKLTISLKPHKIFTTKSVDVSKEDKPISEEPNSEEPSSLETEEFDKKRLEEKFAVLNTGIYECRSCGYKYDEAAGDPSYPIAPGLPFGQLPEDWRCPTCGAAKGFFESKSVEIAGFAQNQQFGLGGNSLTSGQKALLIYGALFFFFCLFLSGYFLQ